MKKLLLILFLLSTTFAGKAQNLVPNGDFEQYFSCPSGISQFDLVFYWINPAYNPPFLNATPDYFHQCSLSASSGVPQNNFGSQAAHSGNAYCGGIIWYGGPTTPNYRENIEAPLTSPLTANQCYHFEMYVALAEQSDHTTSSIGVYFSDTLITVNNYLPLPYTPQIVNTTGFVTDTANWTLISGNYTATGGESYLVIGNFYDDINTPAQPTNFGIFQETYFYIDDVSLTPCTGMEEQNTNEAITIYPNPVKDELIISSKQLGEIKIYDVMGKEIYRTTSLSSDFRPDSYRVPTSDFKPGIYFLEINTGKEIYRKKFLKE
jgi:OOP family OmpA-OmpF porin